MRDIHDCDDSREDARQFDDDDDGINDDKGDADDDELGDEGEEGGSLGENDPRKLHLIQDTKTPILL